MEETAVFFVVRSEATIGCARVDVFFEVRPQAIQLEAIIASSVFRDTQS
jgi:hypothetical protein